MIDVWIDSLWIFFFRDLSGNKISEINSGAFENVDVGKLLTFSNNPLRSLSSYSFNVTSSENLMLQGLQLGDLPSYAFYDVTVSKNLDLQDNSIQIIHPNAFYSVSVGDSL